ncbi:Cytochrome P450 305a1 [Carabus blaptoides fortunei]
MAMATSLLLFIAAVLGIFGFLIRQLKRPKNYPPGPPWLPIIGNLRDVKARSLIHGGQHIAFTKLAEEFNTNVLGLKLGGEHVVVAFSYPIVSTVLSSNVFAGRPDNFFIRTRCMGTRRGITCVDGPLWTEQRNFTVRHLRNAGYGKETMETLINEELDDIILLLEKERPDIDFESIFPPSVLNILWTLSTGIRLHRDDQRLQSLVSMLNKRSKAFDIAGGTMNQLPWLRFIIPEKIGYSLLVKLNKEMKEFFVDTIEQHHETWQPGRRDDLIYSFITEMKTNEEENKNTFTDDQLIMMCFDLFIAGANTTSQTINYIFLNMLLRPEIQQKAAEAIKMALDPNKPLSYADRVKVPYIEAIILEVSRLYGITPVIGPRRVLEDTTLDGYKLAKGTTVLISIHSVHNDKEYWGDPEVFRPERFLDENGHIQSMDRVMNFGLGKRRCLGELLARQCIFIFFVGILRKYQICSVPNIKLPSFDPIPGITLSPQKYKARLIPRI